MPQFQHRSMSILTGVLATWRLASAAHATPEQRGIRGAGATVFDATLYAARDPQLCALPVQLICKDRPGQGSITTKFQPILQPETDEKGWRPLRSDPVKSLFFLPRASGRMTFSAGLLSMVRWPVSA
jgi:hypothetical protein